MPVKPDQENSCGSEGIFSPVAGVLGSLQANETLKTILELKDDLNNNILVFNSLKISLRKIKINSNCDSPQEFKSLIFICNLLLMIFSC